MLEEQEQEAPGSVEMDAWLLVVENSCNADGAAEQVLLPAAGLELGKTDVSQPAAEESSSWGTREAEGRLPVVAHDAEAETDASHRARAAGHS